MGLLSSAFYLFTPYTDARERVVGRFFKRLSEHKHQSRSRAKLDTLLQNNIAVINLWTEFRYKGYKNLRKSQRRQLYANMQLIAEDFDQYYRSHAQTTKAVVLRIQHLIPNAVVDPERAILLQALMDYFAPQRGTYVYRESSSFARLLRDPKQEKLIGDCNQIVTLYIYLYSRYFDVRDLQVRILPEHVALHYGGIDIEATSGTFADYSQKTGNKLLPIEEIVSINLLDTTDSHIDIQEVAAKDFLQASRLAFMLSHDRDIVTHNLKVAYTRLINSLMKRNDYTQALKFAKASQDRELLNIVGHNGAVYSIDHHNYGAARKFAQHAAKRDELIKSAWHAEGAYLYQAQRYDEAAKAFKHLGDQKLVHQCYEAMFFKEQKKLGNTITSETIKKNASTVRHMRTYAKKSGNKELIEYTGKLTKHL